MASTRMTNQPVHRLIIIVNDETQASKSFTMVEGEAKIDSKFGAPMGIMLKGSIVAGGVNIEVESATYLLIKSLMQLLKLDEAQARDWLIAKVSSYRSCDETLVAAEIDALLNPFPVVDTDE